MWKAHMQWLLCLLMFKNDNYLCKFQIICVIIKIDTFKNTFTITPVENDFLCHHENEFECHINFL